MIVGIQEALKLLKEGKPVAVPTETVYGLAAPIDDELALKDIFQIKERPFFDPLIVHASTTEMAKELYQSPSEAFEVLADTFWPGPLTIIDKKAIHVSDLITSSLPTVGVRIPNHAKTLNLINKLKVPLAAPSANMFSKTSPTKASHVEEEFNGEIPVIDGGDCEVGIESTVLGIKQIGRRVELEIFRPGAILKEDLKKALKNFDVHFIVSNQKHGPGQLPYHYQPKIPFYIVKDVNELSHIEKKMELMLPEDSALAARTLYSLLRSYSENDLEALYLIESKYPKTGLWESIWERLQKASFKES